MANNKSYSVIIPCYNEENSIAETIVHIKEIISDNENNELIIVNDGSTDDSKMILEKLTGTDEMLRVIHHDNNRGYGASLKTGIREAKNEIIVITDADGTYPNERIPELASLTESAPMVVGARTGDNVTYSKIRLIPKVFMRWYASWIAGQNIPDFNSGLRAFKKSIVERYLHILPNGFSFTTTITLALLTNYYNVRYIPIDYSARIGKSKIKPIQDTLKFFQLILRTGTYFAPLRVFFPFILLLGFCFLVSLGIDIARGNITDKTILFLLFSMNIGMFALLADMIDKRTAK